MRSRIVLLALALAVPAAAEEPTDFTVLYAGADGSPRMEEWRTTLAQAFSKVDTIDLGELDAETGARADVVIADWPSTYTREGKSGSPPHAALGPAFTKPVILVGEAGMEILPSLGIKLESL